MPRRSPRTAFRIDSRPCPAGWLALALLAAFAASCTRPLGIAGDAGPLNDNTAPYCSDLDFDGHRGYDPQSCPTGDDHCDWDPYNFTEQGCLYCVDADGDGRGPSCDLGSDCDDGDASCSAGECCDGDCVDADGDGRGEGADCLGPDCNDFDALCWAAGQLCCSECELLDQDGDGYGLWASCSGLDCNDASASCHQAYDPCCHVGPLPCVEVVNCGLQCGWPANPSCAQACYESGTSDAQALLEAIWDCADAVVCGSDPECIQTLCPAEVEACFSNG